MSKNNQLVRLKAIKRLAAGWQPDAPMLAEAPVIEVWYADHYLGTRNVCLVRNVTGHPILDDQIVTTSPVMAIAATPAWQRTGRIEKHRRNQSVWKLVERAAAWCGDPDRLSRRAEKGA